MKIIKNLAVPTGNIMIAEGEKGKLEFLSIGDYGKKRNIKADFLGLPNEINGVLNGQTMPLQEKWVITISTQYGCSMNCSFCDVPKVGKGLNATIDDLVDQVKAAISLHPEVKHTKRLNLHYARMGEPSFNFDVPQSAVILNQYFKGKGFHFHPVVSTMMPKNNKNLYGFLWNWMKIKNSVMDGEAGLQLSINTTDCAARKRSMPFSIDLPTISMHMTELLKETGLQGRKIALNIALTDAEVNAKYLAELFDTEYFMIKITPMHKTNACIENDLYEDEMYERFYPYKKVEEELKKAGFDTLVFIPSREEDESRITCGNAILSDKNQTQKEDK